MSNVEGVILVFFIGGVIGFAYGVIGGVAESRIEKYKILEIVKHTDEYISSKKVCEESLPRNQFCEFKWEFVKPDGK